MFNRIHQMAPIVNGSVQLPSACLTLASQLVYQVQLPLTVVERWAMRLRGLLVKRLWGNMKIRPQSFFFFFIVYCCTILIIIIDFTTYAYTELPRSIFHNVRRPLHWELEGRSVERIPPHRPWPLTLTFQNLITLSPVAKGMTDEVWWQSDLNWRQEVVHKHTVVLVVTFFTPL